MVYMSNRNLPKGWIYTTLEQISEIILGQSPPSSTYNIDGKGLPFYQGKLEFGETYPKPRKWCTAPKKIAERGDVLISVRAPVGPTNICPEKSCVGRGLSAIRGLGGIEPLFVLHLMRTFEDEIAGKGTGTTFDAITGNQLRTFEIPLPPLPEQHRIVAKIEELFTKLDAGIDALHQVQAQLKRYRQSVLKAAFEGKLTAAWRAEHQDEIESAPPVASDLPEGWKWISIEEAVRIIDYRGRTPPYSSEGIPHLRSSNIKNGNIIWNDLKYVTEETYGKYMTRGLPQRGDLLFTTEAPLGEVAFVPEKRFSLAQRIMILRPSKHILDSGFLLYQIRTVSFQERLRISETGSVVRGISSRNFKPFSLIVPPLPEQKAIVSAVEHRLSVADEVEKTVVAELKRAEQLRQSILKKAFSGGLVPQDPNDEPASGLLKRIKSEKSQ